MDKKRKNVDSTVSPDTLSSKRRKSDDEEQLVCWANLPGIAVEEIYSYLNREDQRNMSMVCRNWNIEYSSLSLWQKFEFHIPERDVNLEVYPEVQCARKYGAMFRHVEIIWPQMVEFCHTNFTWKQIKLFLEAMSSHSQLETVKFLHMRKYDLSLDITVSFNVHQAIKNFFLSQHKLKTVEFRNAYFEQSEEAELLTLIFHKNSKSLQNVCIVDDVIEETGFNDRDFDDVARRLDFSNVAIRIDFDNVGRGLDFESFLNIKTLQLNYSHFFENIMITFYEYFKNSDSKRTNGNLEFIEIVYDDFNDFPRDYRGIPPECWELLTKICPSLRINLTIQIGVQIRNSFNLFVVPNMPLKVLMFKCHWRNSVEIGVLLRHLQSCRTNEYLEDISIVWPNNMRNLAIDLRNLLPTFKKLKKLDISINNPTQYLWSVLSPWLENLPTTIQTLSITHRRLRASW